MNPVGFFWSLQSLKSFKSDLIKYSYKASIASCAVSYPLIDENLGPVKVLIHAIKPLMAPCLTPLRPFVRFDEFGPLKKHSSAQD